MDQSLSLISAQVQFMEDRLALVHIPLDLYPFFLKPILQVLFHEVSPLDDDTETIVEINVDNGPALEDNTGTATPEQPAFLNISITPVECSVMCPRKLADQYFAPLVEGFRAVSSESDSLSITRDDFIAMQVYGEGLEAGQRVLELTSPLAMAGISIFFVSTYFSDYIIVPYKSKTQVIEALENRGFQFEISTESFANSHNHSQFNRCFSPVSSRSPSSMGSPPSTPPPSTLDELQTRTFTSLHKNHILPSVDRSLRLVQCAAHHRYTSDASSISILREALTTTLLVDNPQFLSLTLTAADPAASLLLEKRLLPRFFSTADSTSEPNDDETSLLLGSKEDILVPIMLDLRKLPLEATGIVCGVASRLAEATHSNNNDSRALHQSTNASTSTTSIAALSSNFRSTIHSSSFDSYIKNVFSSSAGSTNGTPSSIGNGGPVRLTYTHANTFMPMHRLQPDLDNSVDTAVEISFLSTARAGTILVGEYELTRAVDALEAESREQKELEDGLIQGFED